ncbi:TldD/PmbA family protein [Clostridium thermarum]|uniref:TldD/PmbA family protein n=1 Tax=Clostridium thermarum TaxID=1716543 RepID=UPI00111E0846|nr:TldD/PmbA family protein [Clostridium thermarum]
MDIREFKEKLFAKAEESGLKEYEIFYSKNENFNINVYNNELDKYSVSEIMGVGFRASVADKMGYAYTTKLDEESIDFLIKSVLYNAANIENEEKEFIYNKVDNYKEVKSFSEGLMRSTSLEKIDLALKLEEAAKAASEKVTNIGYCGLGCYTEERGIYNSYGVNATHKSNFIYAGINPVVSYGQKVYNEMAYVIGYDIKDINPEVLATEAVKEAEKRIGGTSVTSGKYKVVLRNDVAAELLNTFAGAFCADNAQKGLSLFKDKEGTIVASEKVTLIDNPLMEYGLASTPFDGEGVATSEKAVIDKGSLVTLLHNLKTAEVAKVKTTGNASRPSYASAISVAPTNFYFKPGDYSFEELLDKLGEGLLITDLAGTHAGANPITGDFSLAAKGFSVSGGKIVKPVEQITVAGNFYQLLKDVEEVGKDLKFILPSGSSYYGSASILISKLSVAGK